MSDIIHLLPDSIANQIAAGEVIQRPASVVKELVENSIDAGATKIQVILKDAGRTSIQVIDNGKGMSATDARLSFERHATSKISEAKDLYNLHTMGFRGEALASIASIAYVELQTRQPQDEVGTLIEMEGVFKKQETISCPVGTSFTVKNLFFNVPARRKFLKTNATELRHVIETFQRIVLTYPDLSFTLVHNEEDVYNLTPTNLKQRIVQVFGNKMNQQLLPIEARTTLVNISGFTGNATSASSNSPQFFFVNGRYMHHPYFHKAILEAYARILKPEQKPSYFVFFDIDPSSIDINVHPTKTEIKFEEERNIWQILMVCIKEALGKFNVVDSIDWDTEGKLDFPTNQPQPNQPTFKIERDTTYNPFKSMPSNATKKTATNNWDELYKGLEKKHSATTNVAPLESEATQATPSVESELFNNNTGEEFFQYKNRYIITPVKSGLMFINQQRAHTQILFEEYMQQLQNNSYVSQQLLFPEIVELDAADTVLLKEMMSTLQHLGFDITEFGKQSFCINGIPSALTSNNNITQIINDLLTCAKECGGKLQRNVQEEIAFTLAKTAAIPLEKKLTQVEIEFLVDKLFGCSSHQYNHDGKSIMTIISDAEIDKRF